ncbi:MAG: endonuclease [Chloroflexi bacterium]|nr:endonuclease [Chloroflexota bacterium]
MVLVGKTKETSKKLQDIYQRLFDTYGPQHWWPGETPFEVMVGAILTQSAAWTNVEKAIANLKAAEALSPRALREMSQEKIARLIYSSGYYNAKAAKLKALAEWLGECCGDDIEKLSAMDTDELRRELLAVWGVGEETADSIILYAANQPVFVIDAYTRRIIYRVGLSPEGRAGGFETRPYAAYQDLFMDNLSADVQLFNEYHALLVCLGKNVCKRTPLCPECCLKEICGFSKS